MDDDAMLRDYTKSGTDEITLKSPELEELARSIRAIAQQFTGDGMELLALLRVLEILHREIREGLFQDALPTNRQALYSLLRDIEATGGWPYIHRMRLQEFLSKMIEQEKSHTEPEK
ncbi:hypothetical protein LEP3755_26750 [Leptolyngbya sp. NIES-3755]|nr:hypothetical protein LEP3755_26750 [Leptolyngbya sp. NIES-3755]